MSLLTHGMPCNLLTKGLGESCVEKDICLESNLSIKNIVTTTHDYIPLTGVFSVEEKIDGWLWDRRFVENATLISSMYPDRLGGYKYGIKDGTKKEYWNSGSLQGTEFLSLVGYRIKGEFLSWTPIVRRGSYSVLFEPKNLYSDYSSIEKIDPLVIEDGVNVHPIRDDARIDTISAVLYKRDEFFLNWPWKNYKYVDSFTGKLDDNGYRVPTEGGEGNIIWQNVSNRHLEFIVKDGKIILDRKAAFVVGGASHDKEVLTVNTIKCNLEAKNSGNSDGRDCFTNYFPLMKNSVKVFVVRGNNYVQWSQVENLDFSTALDRHFAVDDDLGIVTLSGYQAPDLVLREPLSELDTEIVFYPNDPVAKSYPDKGIITIGEEQILFYTKGKNRFYNCLRGYNNTLTDSYKIGTKISDTQHGMTTHKAEDIYISYVAVPRIEYEVTDSETRSANYAPFVDLKAISNVITNNILQISPVETHVASIVLETDSPHIGGTLYGPLFYGTDWSKLTARILNSAGVPVPSIDVTIHVIAGPGGLNGSLKNYTALSNSLGEIYVFYNTPYDWESIRKDIAKIYHSEGNTIMNVERLPPNVTLDDIAVFQVLKHDKFYGTQGDRLSILSWSNDPVLLENQDNRIYGHSTITVDAIFEDASSQWSSKQTMFSPEHELDANLDSQMYKNGVGQIINQDPGAGDCTRTTRGKSYIDILYVHKVTNSVTWRQRQILDAIDLWDVTLNAPQRKGTQFILSTQLPQLDNDWEATYCWAVEKDATYWSKYNKSGKFLDGVPVIVYEWSDKVLHPISGEVGAYYPLRPSTISPNKITFEDKLLGIPKPYDKNNNLGGYYVVCGDVVQLIATCVDPVSGKVLMSNVVELELDIPPYLEGVDRSGALPVPYGFGFLTEEFNVGTGLGGANFLTINPVADGVPSFSLNLNANIG